MLFGSNGEGPLLPTAQLGDFAAEVAARWRELTDGGPVLVNVTAPGTAVHAKLNGGEHSSQTISVDSAWHTWRVTWDDAGMRFWKDYAPGAQPYFTVPANSLPDWQFNDPGFTLSPVLG